MNFPWMPFPNPPNSETETHSELCFQALLKTLSHQPLFTSMFHWHCWESYLNECPGGFSFWVFGFGFILHICICRDMTWSFILVFFFFDETRMYQCGVLLVCKYVCRKTQMSMWKDGHRRSPRISALDAWKAHKEKDGGVNVSQNSIQVMPMEHNGLGPPSRTRARKKRKLRPVQDVAVSSVTTTANQVRFPFSSLYIFFFWFFY